MKVYKDLFNNDEMFSDSYPSCVPFDDPELEDVALEVVTRLINKHNDYGIPDNSEEGGGAVDGEQTVIDLVDTFNLCEVPFSSKKEFGAYLKTYMKKLLDKLQTTNAGRVEVFKTKSQLLAKKLIGMYDDLVFYTGNSMDPECSYGFGYYKDGETAPRIVFLKDGMKEEKF